MTANNMKNYNPVTEDPRETNLDFPPSMSPYLYKDENKKLVGTIFYAAGEERKPMVMLLHGFPGNETNFDLAHSIRRNGFNVLVFHYRGSWGSSGDFTWRGSIDDIETVLNHISTDEIAEKLKIDPARIVFIGHSMGGFAAMMHSILYPRIKNIAFTAGYNFGYSGKIIAQKVEYIAEAVKRMNEGTIMLNGTSGKQLWEEMFKNRDSWDLTIHAPKFKDKSLLLIGAEFDTTAPVDMHHKPLVEALGKAGCENLKHEVLKTGHSFSDKRIKLAEIVIDWLNNSVKF